uniref:Secreted protein n=1 Tax=Globodera rostochiensis TaxID=31243 RepID=A0A914H9X9_GLORO
MDLRLSFSLFSVCNVCLNVLWGAATALAAAADTQHQAGQTHRHRGHTATHQEEQNVLFLSLSPINPHTLSGTPHTRREARAATRQCACHVCGRQRCSACASRAHKFAPPHACVRVSLAAKIEPTVTLTGEGRNGGYTVATERRNSWRKMAPLDDTQRVGEKL